MAAAEALGEPTCQLILEALGPMLQRRKIGLTGTSILEVCGEEDDEDDDRRVEFLVFI